MMTRKDYVATADILNRFSNSVDFLTLSLIAEDFAQMFASDNDRFNHQRFIDAVFEPVEEI